jgi:hypothetical protein
MNVKNDLHMKTSNWIKLIGILCIVFGVIGILNGISALIMPKLLEVAKEKVPEVSPAFQRWGVTLALISLLANTLYLMAGVFFIMKKSFSLNLMYIALTLSILCKIVPMMFLQNYTSIPYFYNYDFNIFNLIGPIIDVALLIGVYRLSGYYYKSPEELIELLGAKTPRKALSPRVLKISAGVGILSLSVPLSIFGLWIYVSGSEDTQLKRVASFNTYFPDFLQGRYDTAYLSLAFCVLAIFLSISSLGLSGKLWKAVNIITLIFSIILLMLNLFQMM